MILPTGVCMAESAMIDTEGLSLLASTTRVACEISSSILPMATNEMARRQTATVRLWALREESDAIIPTNKETLINSHIPTSADK
jgi:hypothetical protein